MSRSMHVVAEDLDMPASWIDTRHEATHGRLPSLNRLAATTREALSWLWQHYWSELEKQEGADQLKNMQQNLSLPTEIRAILASFVKKRIEEIKKASDPTLPKSASGVACIDLIRLCRGEPDKLRNVARLLVEPKMLVPADRRYRLASFNRTETSADRLQARSTARGCNHHLELPVASAKSSSDAIPTNTADAHDHHFDRARTPTSAPGRFSRSCL